MLRAHGDRILLCDIYITELLTMRSAHNARRIPAYFHINDSPKNQFPFIETRSTIRAVLIARHRSYVYNKKIIELGARYQILKIEMTRQIGID